MKKKIVKVPIPYNEIMFVIGGTANDFLEAFNQWSKDEEIDGTEEVNYEKEGWTICGKKSGLIGIWLEKPENSVLVHESVHAANYILKSAGIESDRENDEMCAYLTEYIFNKLT